MLQRLSLFFFLMLVTGCSVFQETDTSIAEGAFRLGEKYQKDERFEEAIAQFSQVKNKYPYSKLATEAELRIADIYFEREDYLEAQSAYQVFKELHPTYPRIDFVTYRLGLSLYNQLPSTIDRDLSIASRAITYFDETMTSYPRSEYAGPAKQHKLKALKMMAEKEYYIAHFYFVREKYDSALGRFEDVLRQYEDLGLDAKALYGAAFSAYKIKEMTKAKAYYDQLLKEYGVSKEAETARRELGSRL